MLTGEALNVFKIQMLGVLDNYAGTEARELQLATDLRIGGIPAATAADAAQSLQALADAGLAEKRKDGLRGWVWKISADGHREAAKLALEEGG